MSECRTARDVVWRSAWTWRFLVAAGSLIAFAVATVLFSAARTVLAVEPCPNSVLRDAARTGSLRLCDIRSLEGGLATDLQILARSERTTITPGTAFTATVTVTNTAVITPAAVPLTVTLPASVTDVTWRCLADPGSSCPASGVGPVALPLTLTPGGAARVMVQGLSDPSATGSLTVTGQTRTAPGFAGQTLSSIDLPLLIPRSVFSITTVIRPRPPTPGAPLVYTATLQNLGPSTGNARLEATFTPPMSDLTASCLVDSGSSCLGGPVPSGVPVTSVLSQTVRLLPNGTTQIVYSGVPVDDRFVAPSIQVLVYPLDGNVGIGIGARTGFYRVFNPIAVPRDTAISIGQP